MDSKTHEIVTQVAFKLATEIVGNDRDQSDDTAVSRIALMGDTLTDVIIQKIASIQVGAAFAPQAPAQQQPIAPQAPALHLVPSPIPGVADDGSAAWTDVVQNPSGWWDNRQNKTHPQGPDFKAKNTNARFILGDGKPVALWLNDKNLPPFARTHFGIR